MLPITIQKVQPPITLSPSSPDAGSFVTLCAPVCPILIQHSNQATLPNAVPLSAAEGNAPAAAGASPLPTVLLFLESANWNPSSAQIGRLPGPGGQ